MSDFSDRPLVAGSLTGVRAFSVDRLGRLSGPSHGGIFGPSENVATCSSPARAWFKAARRLSALSQWSITYNTPYPSSLSFDPPAAEVQTEAEGAAPTEGERHQIAGMACACGYYAYFDKGNNPHAGKTTVHALIEGYGVCTVGERGFRAEKAKLVALVDPTAKRLRDRELTEPWTLSRFSLLVALACLVTLIYTAIEGHTLAALITAVAFGANFLLFLYNDMRSREAVGRGSFAQVRANYPGVPVYPSLRAAYREHPLTVPERDPAPTPETHEDFWTMEAPR